MAWALVSALISSLQLVIGYSESRWSAKQTLSAVVDSILFELLSNTEALKFSSSGIETCIDSMSTVDGLWTATHIESRLLKSLDPIGQSK